MCSNGLSVKALAVLSKPVFQALGKTEIAMKFNKKLFLYPVATFVVLLAAAGIAIFLLLRQSLPPADGNAVITTLTAPVTVAFGHHGIPVINARNRLDAIRALGFVTARDRLFQMDLMRRKTAGRLAELFGELALASDVKARTYGFSRVAQAVVAKLPPRHKAFLEAYAEGVNRYIEQAPALPFEFSVLGYRPEPWHARDSILVALGMFERLTARSESEERMLTVMAHALPQSVVAFLTPDTDRYTDELTHHAESLRPATPIPTADLQAALTRRSVTALAAAIAHVPASVAGSNAWAVAGSKTADGRAILANDMHLGISVPNIWYRIELRYPRVHSAGVLLPGVPVLIAGSNENLAWGATNLAGDFLDLVMLDVDPEQPDRYRYHGHWRRFEQLTETIAVKDGQPRRLEVRLTPWGPVAAEPLLGKPVAIRWTALDPEAVTIDLIDLEPAESLTQGMAIVNRTGGPQLNVLLADRDGRIAWTLMGRIPVRYGIDGSVSRSWADGKIGWHGYAEPSELPRRIDPPEAVLVTANDRRVDKHYRYPIGRQFTNGYRAYRISQRLQQLPQATERSLFQLQLDTVSEFYRFYQRLALSVLSPEIVNRNPDLAELKAYLLAWNGAADKDSQGFPLLERFRRQLAEAVFSPFLTACKRVDPNFNYTWSYIDTPLQALLTQKVPQLLPDPDRYRDWDDFILAQLQRSRQQLLAQYPVEALPELTWGRVNRAQYRHPFSRVLPLLGWLLDMPDDALSGCSYCVRVARPHFGASERLVVSPGHLDAAILHMPGGQSSHPLSSYYRDQERYWVNGLPLPLLAGQTEHQWLLRPRSD